MSAPALPSPVAAEPSRARRPNWPRVLLAAPALVAATAWLPPTPGVTASPTATNSAKVDTQTNPTEPQHSWTSLTAQEERGCSSGRGVWWRCGRD
ncbi:hypothetical protein MMEU_1025 [Mycobacterium marinum str. Europe]|nr:hypothetical protein MMEU_1025 [Mycobacterium marinum str. Europe]